jgi:hypothetical protein
MKQKPSPPGLDFPNEWQGVLEVGSGDSDRLGYTRFDVVGCDWALHERGLVEQKIKTEPPGLSFGEQIVKDGGIV